MTATLAGNEELSMSIDLLPGEVHIWRADLDLLPNQKDRFWGLLCPQEKERAKRFRFDEDRKRYVAAHGVLRLLFECYTGIEAGEIQFHHGKYGKPEFLEESNDKGIHFNLSHSHGTALYGFVKNGQIGVDIEKIRDLPEMEQIAGQFFSALEMKNFAKLSGEQKMHAFYKCWTIKEAFVKAIGQGLHFSLMDLDVCIDPQKPARLIKIKEYPAVENHWHVETLKPRSNMLGAVVVSGNGSQLYYAECSSLPILRGWP